MTSTVDHVPEMPERETSEHDSREKRGRWICLEFGYVTNSFPLFRASRIFLTISQSSLAKAASVV